MAATADQIRRLRRLVNEPMASFDADSDGVHAAIVDTGVAQTITTGLTQPPAPTYITATSGGVSADIKAVQVTIIGTDDPGNTQTEVLPSFTANFPTTVRSRFRYASVLSIVVPAHDGLGAATSIGWTAGQGYSDDDLAEVIERYPVIDENGQAPRISFTSGIPVSGPVPPIPDALVLNPYWTESYDLMAAAADIWEEKAGAVIDLADTKSSKGTSKAESQIAERYLARVRHFRARRQPKTLAARPEPFVPDTSYIINQAEAD